MADKDKDTVEKIAAEKIVADKEAASKAVPEKTAVKQKTITLRHTTSYKVYRRAGIIITAQPKEYPVTPEQLTALKSDVWVEVIEK